MKATGHTISFVIRLVLFLVLVVHFCLDIKEPIRLIPPSPLSKSVEPEASDRVCRQYRPFCDVLPGQPLHSGEDRVAHLHRLLRPLHHPRLHRPRRLLLPHLHPHHHPRHRRLLSYHPCPSQLGILGSLAGYLTSSTTSRARQRRHKMRQGYMYIP